MTENSEKKSAPVRRFPLEEGMDIIAAEIGRMSEAGGPLVIAMAGGSGSGKTSLITGRIRQLFSGAVVIPLDVYGRGKDYLNDHPEICWDQPEYLDLGLLHRNLSDLKAGKTIRKPVYSKKIVGRIGYEDVYPAPIIVVEGILALRPDVVTDLDYGIFIETSTHGRLVRRLLRDIYWQPTGQSPREVLMSFLELAQPTYYSYVEPSKDYADIIISNEYDPANEWQHFAGCETRTKYRGASHRAVRNRAVMLGGWAEKFRQKDSYFVPKDGRFSSEGGEIVRIREEKGKYSLTYKGPFRRDGSGARPVVSIAIEPGDVSFLEKEYEKAAETEKTREILVLEGGLSVFLDEVSGLGDFAGIWADSPAKAEAVRNLAAHLGLPEEETRESYFNLTKK